ncbi:MAG: MgtC/SapB family protein [Sphingomonadales bacterium]
MATVADFGHLALALAIGLLIGLERGWRNRSLGAGERVAGLRTFTLIGLVGGVAGLLTQIYGAMVIAATLLALVALLALYFWRTLIAVEQAGGQPDFSATTAIAAVLTLLLGALTSLGYPRLAISAAVVATLILSLREPLHELLKHIEQFELAAALRFLLISVVILPLLPNQGFGPYQAINPYLIWWMVVLIAGLSFVGYVAVKLWGARQGLMLTAALGALVSSTAITLAFARFARAHAAEQRVLAAGVLLASTIMIARIAVVLLVLAPALLPALAAPLAAMAVAGAAVTGTLVYRSRSSQGPSFSPKNPLELHSALFFGIGLGLIIFFARLLEDYFGDVGIYGVALGTGLIDVDAMTVSASQLFQTGTAASTAATAVVLAALANSFAKAVLGMGIGGGLFARRLAVGFGAMVGAGAVVLALSLGS